MPPILSACIYILQIASPYMPLYLWAFIFVIQLVMLVLYPSLIAPLFNKYSPLPEGSLRSAIEALASNLKFPLRKLYVMDGSKRSGHANAYMYGFGKSKRIVLFDTLLDQCNENQVCCTITMQIGQHFALYPSDCALVQRQKHPCRWWRSWRMS
jgi:STE24 endopeptidase